MEKNKIIAQKTLEIIGGEPIVNRYWNSSRIKYVDIFRAENRPYQGVISYATIGLSDNHIGMTSENKSLRVELLGACDINQKVFPNILSTTAFEIMDAERCKYGEIIPRVVELYIPEAEMKHICLIDPILWEGFNTTEFNSMKVAWLLMVPISDAEMKYAAENGIDALELKFEEADIDIFNLNRKSIL